MRYGLREFSVLGAVEIFMEAIGILRSTIGDTGPGHLCERALVLTLTGVQCGLEIRIVEFKLSQKGVNSASEVCS
jgi:hypothetical protein